MQSAARDLAIRLLLAALEVILEWLRALDFDVLDDDDTVPFTPIDEHHID